MKLYPKWEIALAQLKHIFIYSREWGLVQEKYFQDNPGWDGGIQ